MFSIFSSKIIQLTSLILYLFVNTAQGTPEKQYTSVFVQNSKLCVLLKNGTTLISSLNANIDYNLFPCGHCNSIPLDDLIMIEDNPNTVIACSECRLEVTSELIYFIPNGSSYGLLYDYFTELKNGKIRNIDIFDLRPALCSSLQEYFSLNFEQDIIIHPHFNHDPQNTDNQTPFQVKEGVFKNINDTIYLLPPELSEQEEANLTPETEHTKFNLARHIIHQKIYLQKIEQLRCSLPKLEIPQPIQHKINIPEIDYDTLECIGTANKPSFLRTTNDSPLYISSLDVIQTLGNRRLILDICWENRENLFAVIGNVATYIPQDIGLSCIVVYPCSHIRFSDNPENIDLSCPECHQYYSKNQILITREICDWYKLYNNFISLDKTYCLKLLD